MRVLPLSITAKQFDLFYSLDQVKSEKGKKGEPRRKEIRFFAINPKTRKCFKTLKYFHGALCLRPHHTEIALAHLFHNVVRLVLTSLIAEL